MLIMNKLADKSQLLIMKVLETKTCSAWKANHPEGTPNAPKAPGMSAVAVRFCVSSLLFGRRNQEMGEWTVPRIGQERTKLSPSLTRIRFIMGLETSLAASVALATLMPRVEGRKVYEILKTSCQKRLCIAY